MLMLSWSIVAGCGSAEYEARLQRTQALYEYLAELDRALVSPAWNRSDVGLAMRLPIPFSKPLAAPVPEKDAEGNPLPITDDPRQPDVLGVDLPGLVDAWQGSVNGAEGESQALFFVCSNHQRFLDLGPQTAAPDAFLSDLEVAIQTGFGILLPEGESQQPADNVRYRHLAPSRSSGHAKYTTSKDYTAIRFVPTEPLGGRDLEGMLFEHRTGKIQLGILCIFPRDAGSQFRDRLHLALETLVASGEAPKPRSGSAGGGGVIRQPGF